MFFRLNLSFVFDDDFKKEKKRSEHVFSLSKKHQCTSVVFFKDHLLPSPFYLASLLEIARAISQIMLSNYNSFAKLSTIVVLLKETFVNLSSQTHTCVHDGVSES